MSCRDTDINRGYYLHSEKLGEGGFGCVRLATHLLTKEKVAVKVIDKKKIKKDLFRVDTEINALRVLRHKNIARLLQVIYSEKYIYLIMEYCSGGELFDHLIEHRQLPEEEVKKIIKTLVGVLGYIHKKGFAHRDIKPENILLDANNNVKVIDFGLCADSSKSINKTLDGLTTACGSPAYVAPELLNGESYNGAAADIWSTGVLMFTLLTGQLPFHDDTLPRLYKKICNATIEMPSRLSANGQDLLQRMLCKDPNQRITVDQILAHPWLNSKIFPLNLPFFAASEEGEDESQLNENILIKCAALFPDHKDLNQLRTNVIANFGYETATYWLINANPTNFKDFVPMPPRRRSISFSDATSVNQESASKRKNEDTAETSVKKVIPSTDVKAKVPLTRGRPTAARKLFPSEKTTTSNLAKNAPTATTPDPYQFRVSSRLSKTDAVTKPTPSKRLKCVDDLATVVDTPKKSFFRKLLERATPRKATSPRRISSNDRAHRALLMTNFTEADKCKEFILRAMQEKLLNCTVNNFTIRCVMSATNTIIVALDLELLVCSDTRRVAIKPRRISGNSTEYFMVCNHLKRKLK